MQESSFNPAIRERRRSAIANVVFGTLLMAVGPFFVEFSNLDALGSSFYRLLVGGISFLLIAIYRKEKLPEKQFLGLYFAAAAAIALDLIFYNQSILYIGSGLATVLANLEIMFLLLIGALCYKEKLGAPFLISCLFITAGIYLLLQPYLSEVHPDLFSGIVYALGASMVFSIYLTVLKIIGKKNPGSSTASNLGMICALGAALLGILIVLTPSASFALPPTWQGSVCIVIYSLISQVCGWWFVSRGMGHLELSVSGVLFLLQPVLTFLGDCVFLRRNTALIQIAGCFVLLITVYKIIYESEKRKVVA